MFILSIILGLPCGVLAYAKVLHHFTKEICCGFIMVRLVLKLSFLVDDLREIKYILYLAAFIYGFFIGCNLIKES
jgi:tetrahydromethanopterin S-methyltransferase subunit E